MPPQLHLRGQAVGSLVAANLLHYRAAEYCTKRSVLSPRDFLKV
jgi:hypothetical protein